MKLRSLFSLVSEQTAQKAKTTSYYGEFCPECKETKMSSYSPGPFCEHCRGKHGLTEDDMKSFVGHRILIDQYIIKWRTKPNPQITGTVDDKPWQSSFINEKWHTHSLEEPPNRNNATLVSNFLNIMTPVWKKAAESKRTKIRRYAFIAAVGVTVATTKHLLKKGKPKENVKEE